MIISAMFDILFGWRKASKCKNLIRRVQCRLKLLKNKRCTIVRQLREDVAELIKSGYEEIAIDRAEQLFKDESIVSVYELLDNFCEFILVHMPYIRRNRDCPNDINEAASSLIFASARCGDLPELRMIRKLFGERYGERFAKTAVELHPGNLVNSQIREKLSIKLVSDEVKLRLVNDIAKDYCLKPEILALEYTAEFHKQVQMKENVEQQGIAARVDSSGAKDMQTDAVLNDSNVAGHDIGGDPSNSLITLSPEEAIFALQCSTRILGMLMHKQRNDKVNYGNLVSPYALAITSCGPEENDGAAIRQEASEQKEETAAISSSQGSPQISEEKVVFLDDVEEVQSPIKKKGDDQDQRVFKFKPSLISRNEISEDSLGQGYLDQSDSWDEKSASRSFRKSKKMSSFSGKRIRRRSVSRERSSIEDLDCLVYYNEPSKNPTYYKHRPSHCQSKHPKTNSVEQNEISFGLDQKLKQPCCANPGNSFCASKCVHVAPKVCPNCCINCKMNTFSSNSPCNLEDPSEERKDGIRTSVPRIQVAIRDHSVPLDAKHAKSSDVGSIHVATPKPKTGRAKVDTVYEAFTYPDHKEIKKLEDEYDSSSSQTSTNTSASVNHPPYYTRAITMPAAQPREDNLGKIPRSYSCAFPHPNHVHPKLPDYDDVAAKFMALKKEHLQARILSNARQVH